MQSRAAAGETRSRSRSVVAVVLLLGLVPVGCGPTSTRNAGPSTPAELRTLDEDRALVLIAEVLADEGVARGPLWTVPLAQGLELSVDVRLAQSSFGIEWVSPQDRADLGDAVPRPATDGQLRIAPGDGDASDAQILILDHSTYEFANEREHVQRGVPGAREAEVRLHRDVRDFLQYVRGQGGI